MQKMDPDGLNSIVGGVISGEAAYQKALSHAGLNKYQATPEKSTLISDSKVPKYDVVFTTGGMSYEYFINAETGKVMGYTKTRLR